jgi:hypothetical protein
MDVEISTSLTVLNEESEQATSQLTVTPIYVGQNPVGTDRVSASHLKEDHKCCPFRVARADWEYRILSVRVC